MLDPQPIVARATPLGEGAIAVVRLSGPGVFHIADTVFFPENGRPLSTAPQRSMVYGRLVDGQRILDRPLAVRFVAPYSFTGEDMIEFHLHGNPLIVEAVLRLCIDAGCRLALPGEFSRRAFLNGKMDLAQAEGLAEVIRAESDAALDLAQRQLGGELSRRFQGFRQAIVEFLALMELELDFVQEGYELLDTDRLLATLNELRHQVAELLASYRTGDRLRRGPRILLLGRPNAGKSSLFNAILGYSRALVSDVPGTTRDYIEERLLHRGVVLHFLDSAGIRETTDAIESEGVARAHDLIPLADHILYLIDGTLSDADRTNEFLYIDRLSRAFPEPRFIPVLTKSDLGTVNSVDFAVSVFQRHSIEALLDNMTELYTAAQTSRLLLLSQRQFFLLRSIDSILKEILQPITDSHAASLPSELFTELISTDLRSLLQPLSELTGETTNEDVLDAVFSSFCIGK